MERVFEWDPSKALLNLQKHGVAFEDAVLVFFDPLSVARQDRIEGGERRWQTVGMADGAILLLVAHTVSTVMDEDGNATETIRIISARALTKQERKRYNRSENVMQMVRFKQGDLPPISAKRRAELQALAARPDHEVDCSDIPLLDEDFWRNAQPNPFYKPRKTAKTLRLDADVLAWFMATGKGYQTRMNAVLRAAMVQQIAGKTG